MPRISIKNFSPAMGSHMIMLIKIFGMSEGPVLELGIGSFSTPLLHMLCFRDNRPLFSYDNDTYFVNAHRGFITPWHRLALVDDWDKIDIENTRWGMAFMDHGPGERRVADVKRVANNAQFVVIHDTEPKKDGYYKSKEASRFFKYKFDYTKLVPNTSVFSNFVDVTNLKI